MESWRFRMTKTVFLVFTWVSMGLYISIYGPTLIDLKMMFNTNYGSLSSAIAGRGVGIPVAAIISGILADKFPNCLDLMVALSATLVAICTAAVPYVNSTDALWFLCFCVGFGVCSTNIGGQRLIITMWRDKAAPPTHAMHGGFGIGAVLIPLLVNPLLAVIETESAKQNTSNIAPVNPNISGIVLDNYDRLQESMTNWSSANISYSNSTGLTSRNQANGSGTNLTSGPHYDVITNTTADKVPVVLKESRIEYAFLAVGLFTFTFAVPFFIFQFMKFRELQKNSRKHKQNTSNSDYHKQVKARTFREIINPSTYTDGQFWYGVVMFLLLFVFYGNVVGGEQMFGLFVRSFSVDSLNFSKDESSYLNMVYWLGFTFSRMLFTGLAHFIPIHHLITIEVALLVISVTLLDIIGASTPLILWIFTPLLGMLYSPLFPSGISYVNTLMDVSGVSITIVLLGSGVGDILYSSLAGKFYDLIGPRAVLYAMQASGCLIFIAVLVMRVVSRGRKERYAEGVTKLSVEVELKEVPKAGDEIHTFLQDTIKDDNN